MFSGREGVPSIKAVAKQIRNLLKKTKLETVFLATDGSDKGWCPFYSYFSSD